MRLIFLLTAIFGMTACQPKSGSEPEPQPQQQSKTKSAVEPAFECGKERNTVEITTCLEKQVQRSSDRVQTALRRNLKEAAEFDNERRELEGSSSSFDPNTHVNAVKSSQAAWEKYADAHCTLESFKALGGTSQSHYYAWCIDRLNLQRLKELRSPFMLESQRLQPIPEE